ncbi:MAG TPA: VOC family protein, partial [Micromonosporaceae bacterium]
HPAPPLTAPLILRPGMADNANRAGLPAVPGVPKPRSGDATRSAADKAQGGNDLGGDEPGGGVGQPEGAGLGVMLLVSDLAASIHFYVDLLGCGLTDRSAESAVLTFGSSRILLHQANLDTVDRRGSLVQLLVSDLETAYQDLRARGVKFDHQPRMTVPGQRLELWSARLRDPDEHGIALTEWREREQSGPGSPWSAQHGPADV